MIANEVESVSQTLPRADLSTVQRDEMFELLKRHCDGVTARSSKRTWRKRTASFSSIASRG